MERKSKKKNGFLVFLKVLLIVFLVIILALAGWLLFSAFDRKSPLEVVPSDYSVFLHTDNIFNAAEPLLDLKAADTFLANKEFSQIRKVFMSIKSSPLRKNSLVRFALGRKAHIALYTEKDQQFEYVVALDLSFISGATRLLPVVGEFIFDKINQPEISYIKKSDDFETFGFSNFIKIKTDDASDSVIYIKPYKNLLVVTSSLSMFKKSFSGENLNNYSAADRKNLIAKSSEPFKIVADSKKLITSFIEPSPMASELLVLLKENEQSTVEFGISDFEINLNARIPLDFSNAENSSLIPVLKNNSTLPVIVSQLPDEVQYYTLLNIANLDQLKESVFPLIKTKKDINKLWSQADSLSSSLLNASLEDILFSWTGKELIVFGVEGNKEPVFALKVEDEIKRRKVFDDVFSSFLVTNNATLIVGGARLPCLELPSFIVNLLSAFGVNLPSPYYLVQGDYIYFSESPQNLSIILNSIKNDQLLTKTENFKTVTSGQNSLSSISLYYNLERSLPFFVQGGTPLAEVLKLYNIGRVDIRVKNQSVYFQLHAASVENTSLKLVPGFPVAAGARSDYVLLKMPGKNSRQIFWLENKNVINSFDLDTLQVNSVAMGQNCTLAVASEKSKNGGVLWATCANGAVYLLDKNLEPCDHFPVILEGAPVAESAASKNSLVVPSKNGKIFIISEDGYMAEKNIAFDLNIKSAPVICDNFITLYDKSFDGGLLVYDLSGDTYTQLEIDGLCSGSPAVVKVKSTIYTAFVTQSGLLYLYQDNAPAKNFPIQLENVFNQNAVWFDGYFYLLSNDATIYRVSLTGEILSLRIPDSSSARSGFINTVAEGENKGLYVCADSNIIYGFTKDLEVLNGFPVAGCGVPVFGDVNNDGKTDCLALSVDKKLYAWTIR